MQEGDLETEVYFKLQIERPYVKVRSIDSDEDDIYDIIDPLPRLSNSLVVGMFGVIGIPISIIADKIKIKSQYKEK